MTKSTDGREWAHLSKLKSGDKIVADGGFVHGDGKCIRKGAVLEVRKRRKSGELFVNCKSRGGHTLAGQLDRDGDSLVGFWPA